MTLLSPKVGHNPYDTGEALTDLDDVDWHVNQVCKVQKQSRGEEKVKVDKGVCAGCWMTNLARSVEQSS